MIDPLDSLLGYQLRRASAVMMADLAATLAPLRLRPTEASVLLAIAANPGASQSDVGRLLGIQRANMAPLIATLLAAGTIERAASDGRSQSLRLSSNGETLAHQVASAIAKHEARFLPNLSAPAHAMLLRNLRSIRSAGDAATSALPLDRDL